jgi:hypothetical protein
MLIIEKQSHFNKERVRKNAYQEIIKNQNPKASPP